MASLKKGPETGESSSMQRHRFDDFTKSQEATALPDRVSAKTQRATKFWLNVFSSFLREKSISIVLNTCGKEELDSVIRRFYGGLRSKSGRTYSRESYLASEASLANLGHQVNIFLAGEFRGSNAVLDGVLKKNKADGKEKQVQHKDAITEDDLARLKTYFSDVLTANDTYKLQSYCWFNIPLHFDLRGGEVFAKLTKDNLVFKTEGGSEEAEIIVYANRLRDEKHTWRPNRKRIQYLRPNLRQAPNCCDEEDAGNASSSRRSTVSARYSRMQKRRERALVLQGSSWPQ